MNFFAEHYFILGGSNPRHVGSTSNIPLYYGIQYNHSGRLHLRIDGGRDYQVEGPYAFFTHPGAYFDYGCVDGAPRHHNFICSRGERIQSYIKSGLMDLNRENPLIRVANPERFLQTMLSILALMKRPGALPPRAVLLYEDLLLQLYESEGTAFRLPPFQDKFFSDLIRKIRENPEQEWNFDSESAACSITSTHFRRIFKNLTGLPPHQFLIQVRLQKAAQMLIRTRDSVRAIAESIGLENPFYFSRLFKEKYQVSPLEYRREFYDNV